jgi:uncharacterized protein YdeI (YjbR/CyaY-like superfamily)
MAEEIRTFATIVECAAHMETAEAGFWMRIGKGPAAGTTVTYDEGLTVALRFGWIDGQKKALDDTHWLQRFTPRTARSRWSARNREIAERLIAAGEMAPAGLAAVEAARADGRWNAAYAGPRTATVPDDLADALRADPAAEAFFASLTSANRYAILYRVAEAKRPETRAARIEKFVRMCHDGITIH